MYVHDRFYSDREFDKIFSQLDPTENYIKINGQWKPREQSK